MNKFYKLPADTLYNSNSGLYVSTFWNLKSNLSISSPLKSFKGDIVSIRTRTTNGIIVAPESVESPDDAWDLVFLAPSIPLNEKHDYIISSDTCELILTLESLFNKNKSYIILAAAPPKRISRVFGREKTRGYTFEFLISTI